MPEDVAVATEQPEVKTVSIDTLPQREYKEARAKGVTEVEVKTSPGVKETEDSEEKPEARDGEQPRNSSGKFQKRYDNLFKHSKSVEAELERVRKENEELRGKTSTVAPKEIPADETAAKDEDPEPKMEDFKTIPEYVKAQAKWELRQHEKEVAAKSEKQAAADRKKEIADLYDSRVVETKKTHPDYSEVVGGSKLMIPETAVISIRDPEMENGPEVAYYLGKNPDFCEKLMNMSAGKVIAEVWKLSEKLAGETKTEDEPEEEKPISKAPEPIKPVSGGSSRSSVSLDKMSLSEYKKARAAGRQH